MKKIIFSKSTLVCVIIVVIALSALGPFKSYYQQKAIDDEVARLEAAEAAGELGEMNQTGYVDHVLIKNKADISDTAMEELKSRAHYTTVCAFLLGKLEYADVFFEYYENSNSRGNDVIVAYKVTDDIYSQPFYYAVEFENVKIDSEDDIECNEYVLGTLGEGDIELEEGFTVFSTLDKVKEHY